MHRGMASLSRTSATVLAITATVATILIRISFKKSGYKRPADVGTPVDESGAPTSKGSKSAEEQEWDVVVIGGGTSGCVIASRLSERPDLRVLLLEAGGSGSSLLLSRIPSTYPLLFHSKHDWNLYTVPQKNTLNRKWFWPRGKMLGGCSAINAMMYHYGAPDDLDEWSAGIDEPGASQWTYANFSPYYKKFEKFNPHKEFPHVDLAHRGDSGKVQTGFFGNHGSWSRAFVKTCEAIGIPKSADLNTLKGSLGVTKIMTYITPGGERSTTETGYLTKDVLARPNLRVVIGAHVTKILFETVNGEKQATGVEFSDRKGNGDKRYRVKVNKEVILSAGAVHSPHILMLSGVGPAEHLKQHNISVEVDLPGVGQHLLDHPLVETMYRPLKGSISYIKPGNGSIALGKTILAGLQWLLTRTGPVSTNISEAAAFVRTDDPALFPADRYPKKIEDSTSGPGAPDLELIAVPLGLKRHGDVPVPSGPLASMGAVLLRPTSVGSITLSSANPFDNPIIDPNYLDTQHDVDVLVRGIRLMLEISKSEPFASGINQKERNPQLDQDLHKLTDQQLEYVVRERAETLYHPTSTVRMAPLSEGGCVDYYLRLRGVPNLRVVDDSILPNIVSGHTAGPAIALGEKVSDLIKEAWAKQL